MSLIKCIECGGILSDSTSVCSHCGAPVIKCRDCGRLVPAGQSTCPNCGAQAPAVYEEATSEQLQRTKGKIHPPSPQALRQGTAHRRRRISMKVLILTVVLILLVLTCPSRQKHERVVENLIDESVGELRRSAGIGTDFDAVCNLVCDQFTEILMAHKFDVDNYVMFSIGKIRLADDDRVVTFGIANHVFCIFPTSDLKAAVKKWKGDQRDSFDNVFDIVRQVFGRSDDSFDDNTDKSGSSPSQIDRIPDNSDIDDNSGATGDASRVSL